MGVAASGEEAPAPTVGAWTFDLDTPFDAITRLRPLAQGSACMCCTGKLRNADVVVKSLKPGSTEADALDLDKELQVLQVLQHAHIVRLAGAGRMPQGGTFVATELLARGTLSAALGTASPEGTSWIGRALVRTWFPLQEAWRQAAGVASALAYMHDEAMPGAKIVHRDIKGTNLAFGGDGNLKLFDFGLAKILRPSDLLDGSDSLYKMTGETGSLRYMPPEVAKSQPSNETADVYSFALVVWEMASLELPFKFYGVSDIQKQVVDGGVRPRLHMVWPESFRDILTRCWSADVNQRPRMADVEQRLRQLAPKTGAPS